MVTKHSLFFSAKRSIQHLLDKWGLQCRLIPRESFDFDEERFIEDEEDSMQEEKDSPSCGGEESHVKVLSGTLASVFLLEISIKGSPLC